MSKRAMIIIFSVVIVVLVIMLIWGISMRDGWSGWNWGISFGGGSAGLTAGTTFEYPLSDVQEVDLNLLSEGVAIEPTDGDVIRVEQISERGIPNEFRMRCGVQGGRLLIESGVQPVVSCGFNSTYHSDIRVSIPRKAVLTTSIDALSGRVEIRDLELADLDVDAASGQVSLRNVTARAVSAETASGNVNVAAGSFDSLRCETASGSIDVEADVRGEAHLSSMSGAQRFNGTCSEFDSEAASGDVSAEVRGAATIDAEAMSGNVNLVCPDVAGLNLVDVETASGQVSLSVPEGTALSVDFESMSGNLRLDEMGGLLVGSGGVQVNVETASGDLTVRSLKQ